MRYRTLIIPLMILITALSACSSPATPIDPPPSEPPSTNTPVPTATLTPTSTPEPTATPEPTRTPRPTDIPPTPTPTIPPIEEVENLWQSSEIARLTYTQMVTSGDIDRDGDLDIAAVSREGQVAWYQNTGNASDWQKQTIDYSFDWAHDVLLVDMDQDG
nr:VCBS repeat-containing protein [Anaerolineae bacterium]